MATCYQFILYGQLSMRFSVYCNLKYSFPLCGILAANLPQCYGPFGMTGLTWGYFWNLDVFWPSMTTFVNLLVYTERQKHLNCCHCLVVFLYNSYWLILDTVIAPKSVHKIIVDTCIGL